MGFHNVIARDMGGTSVDASLVDGNATAPIRPLVRSSERGRDERLPAHVAILGRGKLGTSLAGALNAVGVSVDVGSARDDMVVDAALGWADLILLAVPDGAVRSAAERLAARPAGAGRPSST